jgi:LacI family transcriptional regulator
VGLLRADYQTGIDQAIDLLVRQGHRRIAHISGTPGLPSPTTTARVDAYKSAMARHGLSAFEIIAAGDFKLDGGKAAMQRLLAVPHRPTAVLAANDLTAIGALQAVKEIGLRVPADISLIGLDDVNLTVLVDPPLTTVALPRFEIGKNAMTILLDRLENPSARRETIKHVFSTRLVVRDSTAPPAS